MMKKLLLLVFLFNLLCVSAFSQDWKSILSGVAKEVIGDKLTTAESFVGTWEYVSPACKFESDNLLAKAGGEAAAVQVEQKLEPVYNKIGLDSCELTFKKDSTYVLQLKKGTSSGTYSFDAENKTLVLKTKLGVAVKAQVEVVGNTMNLHFNADKLMSALQMLTNLASKINANASTINSLISNYDGLMLGLELKRAENSDISVSH